MSAILAILRAAHCRSTHHYFAIDAIQEVSTEGGQRLGQMLLANFAQYLRGAKDPDTVFKDFENHVVHVSDGFWGGAARTAEKWLARSHQFLARQEWGQAAYAIGVLSHYFTDPWMPLHTGQSPRETVIHRPLEWSVRCAYEELMQHAMSCSDIDSFDVSAGDLWLTDAIHAGAQLAHAHYDALMDDYAIHESHRSPALALGDHAKDILAKIFVWVLTGWGSALDRIAQDCRTPIPQLSLALPTLLATVQAPTKKILATVADIEQRREIATILEEYRTTGKITRNISLEQAIVGRARDLHPTLRPPSNDIHRARLHPFVVDELQPKAKAVPLPSPQTAVIHQVPPPECDASDVSLPDTHPSTNPTSQTLPTSLATNSSIEAAPSSEASYGSEHGEVRADALTPPRPSVQTPQATDQKARKRLELTDPIVDAPAIGPKTAQRLMGVGIETIDQLLRADPEVLAGQLKTQWITSQIIANWQTQSHLVLQIRGLSAAGAGLLVLAGIASRDDLLEASPAQLHQQLAEVSQTADGQRILRGKAPPSLTLIEKWISRIRLARRAA